MEEPLACKVRSETWSNSWMYEVLISHLSCSLSLSISISVSVFLCLYLCLSVSLSLSLSASPPLPSLCPRCHDGSLCESARSLIAQGRSSDRSLSPVLSAMHSLHEQEIPEDSSQLASLRVFREDDMPNNKLRSTRDDSLRGGWGRSGHRKVRG